MSTWKQYQNTIRGCEAWDEIHPDYLNIAERFATLSGNEMPSPELAWQILESISRGHALIRAARNWTNPSIGNRKSTEVAECRGEQWRFFQVFAGFEVMAKAVFGYHIPNLSITWGELRGRINTSGLFENETLPSPMKMHPVPPTLKRWVNEPEKLNRFLGVYKWDVEIFNKWLTQGNDLKGSEVLNLAIALRNVTGHGKLSPTKAKQWGICHVFLVLSKILEKKSNSVLESLI